MARKEDSEQDKPSSPTESASSVESGISSIDSDDLKVFILLYVALVKKLQYNFFLETICFNIFNSFAKVQRRIKRKH